MYACVCVLGVWEESGNGYLEGHFTDEDGSEDVVRDGEEDTLLKKRAKERNKIRQRKKDMQRRRYKTRFK